VFSQQRDGPKAENAFKTVDNNQSLRESAVF
jgi:hypothetical protein